MNIKQKALSPLSFPTPSKSLKATPTDRNFHRLIEQSLLGLPIEKLLEDQPQYQLWFNQIQQEANSIWTLPENQKAVDYTINYCHKKYRLCTTYDLLLVEVDRAEIIHFRTDSEISFGDLSEYPCTQLDLFLLVQSLGYLPEQVSLTYWFLSKPQAFKLSIPYSSRLHKPLGEQISQGNLQWHTTPMSVAQFDESRNSPPTAFEPENSRSRALPQRGNHCHSIP